ncbi:hypothetical protein [Bifidobacterium crudilactis]|uniref:hypothetical protein n=1 Tax=Bifidobacterium crudilactis TaxID=327277 RepID=UPI0012EB49B5|nr:hypothetical protein [Bifidobacterium crudilactis]
MTEPVTLASGHRRFGKHSRVRGITENTSSSQSFSGKKFHGSLIMRIIFVALTCIIAELFIFNASHWLSASYQPIADVQVTYGSGLKSVGEGVYILENSDEATITLSHIGQHVDNIDIPITRVTTSNAIKANDYPVPRVETFVGRSDSSLHVSLRADDAVHTLGMELPQRVIHRSVPSSQVIRLHLAGNTKSIVVNIHEHPGTELEFSGPPRVNVRAPLSMNPLRLAVYVLLLILVGAWPMVNKVWRREQDLTPVQRKTIWIGAATLSALLSVMVTMLVLPWVYMRMTQWQADFEYQSVARALASGHSWIDYPVADMLTSMQNPYQSDLRELMKTQTQQPILFDYVFYDGKYFSYFGVLPALLFFLPYHVITGGDLVPWKVILILGVILAMLSMRFVYLCFKRFSPKTHVLVQAAVGIAFMCAVQPVFYLSFLPTTYSVPIATGLCLALGAACCWFRALDYRDSSRFRYGLYLVAGGVLCGLIVGCRPQLCAVALLLPMLLIVQKLSEGSRVSTSLKAALPGTLVAACSAVLIGIPFLVWNKIRFGSLLDFGASYQLTVTDQRAQIDGLSKVPYALWQAFIVPASVTDQFPFLTSLSSANEHAGGYQGFFYSEPALGGILFWFPLGLLMFLVLSAKVRRTIGGSKVALIVAPVVLSMLTIIVDASSSAYAARYLCDFGLLIGIASMFTIVTVSGKMDVRTRGHFNIVLLVLVGITLALNLWSIVMSGRFAQLSDSNPSLYVMLQQMLSW